MSAPADGPAVRAEAPLRILAPPSRLRLGRRRTPEVSGVGGPMLRLISPLVVALLHLPRRWYADLKTRRTAWWLSLL